LKINKGEVYLFKMGIDVMGVGADVIGGSGMSGLTLKREKGKEMEKEELK